MASPSGEKRDALRVTAQNRIDRWERELTVVLERLWEQQQGVVLARLRGTKARAGTRHWMPVPKTELKALNAGYIVDVARWISDAVKFVGGLLEGIYRETIGHILKGLGLPGQGRAGAVPLPDGVPDGSVFTPSPAKPRPVPTQGIDRPARSAAAATAPTLDVDVPTVPDRDGTPVPIVESDVVQSMLQGRIQQAAQQVAAKTQQVADVIRTSEAEGVPIEKIADRVEELYASRAPGWTQQIVQTNVVGAVNESSMAAAAAAGVRSKQWLAAHDSRVRDSHREADGQVVPITGSFTLARGTVDYPGDPAGDPSEVINCRCTLLFPLPALGQPVYDPKMFSSKAFNPGQPRYPRGTPKAGQWMPVGGNDFSLAGRAPDVRALIATHQGAKAPNPANTRVIAARDARGRVSGYLAWQSVAEPGFKVGDVRSVWVHRNQQGQGLGAALQRNANSVEPAVPATRASSAAPAAPAPVVAPVVARKAPPTPAAAPQAPGSATGGPTGDFAADSKRVDALQRKYLSAGLATNQQFMRGGRYTAARQKEQQAIVDHFADSPTAKSDSQLLLMGGMPGAGKTTFLNSAAGKAALGIQLDEYVTVNADEVKAEMIKRGMVPTYPGLAPEEAATLYHDESFEIANAVMRKAIAAKKNVAYDTSLKSPYQLQLAQQPTVRTAPPPYTTTLVFVDVDVDTAKARAQSRYLAGDRYTPMGYIDSLKSGRSTLPAQSFQQVKGSVDRWLHVENNTTPTIVAQGGGARRARRSGS